MTFAVTQITVEWRRVLVTGSREWVDRAAVERALESEVQFGPMIIVHGDAPGLDTLAKEWALVCSTRFLVWPSAYPARWTQCRPQCYHPPRYRRDGTPYCPAAGTYRNQEMVDSGAAVCHAFPLRQSKGTWHCMDAAAKAGITVINHGFGSDEWKATHPDE